MSQAELPLPHACAATPNVLHWELGGQLPPLQLPDSRAAPVLQVAPREVFASSCTRRGILYLNLAFMLLNFHIEPAYNHEPCLPIALEGISPVSSLRR